MQDTVDALELAAGTTGNIVRALTADDLSRPTPCAGWDVQHVLNHVVGGMRLYAAELTGAPAPGDHEDDWLGNDPHAAYTDAAASVLAAWRAAGAEQRTIQLSFGSVPAPMAAVVELTEILVHGLDIAVATGREELLDEAQCESLFQSMRAMGMDAFRVPGIFDAERPAAADAPSHVRLLAYLGRELAAVPT